VIVAGRGGGAVGGLGVVGGAAAELRSLGARGTAAGGRVAGGAGQGSRAGVGA
jgi:hypothetical protein